MGLMCMLCGGDVDDVDFMCMLCGGDVDGSAMWSFHIERILVIPCLMSYFQQTNTMHLKTSSLQ